jgi:patatin-like phospholipase/acyl hydrolase
VGSGRRILSIDGGGLKGALPIGFLARVEEVTGERIADHFDLIAGTSTGGIIAIALGLGFPASDILAFYQNDGAEVFGDIATTATARWGDRLLARCRNTLARGARRVRQVVAPKHSPVRLRQALERVFGQRLLGESLTRLVIPAYHPDRRTVYVFKTSHHERFEVDHRTMAVDAAMATAAAPTYFPAHRAPSGACLVDGGIWANNPTGMAVIEAIGVLGWDRTSLKVLSLGCTDEVLIPDPDTGLLQLGSGAVDLLMQGQAFGSLGTAKILIGERNLHRINPTVPRGLFALDDATKVDRLAGMGAECARDALPMLRREFLVQQRDAFIPFHGCRSARSGTQTSAEVSVLPRR